MTMFEPSPQSGLLPMELPLMSSREVSPAKTYHSPEKGRELRESDHLSGESLPGLLARYDPDTSSWKTSQRCAIEAWESFCQIWPRAGMMRSGIAYQRRSSARRTTGTGSGLLPTPSGTSNHGKNHVSGRLDEWGGSSNPFRGTEIGKIHSPRFEEWMMGFPDRWTELTDCETPWSRKSPN